uniref:Uncharacterized protein n=1 Tax=Arundo donax TaxID=35708 RepID=A0A0A8ZG72_ARUDO
MYRDLTNVVQWLHQLGLTGLSLLEAFGAEAMNRDTDWQLFYQYLEVQNYIDFKKQLAARQARP